MKLLSIRRLAVVLLPLVVSVFLSSVAFGQKEPQPADTIDKSPQAEEFDKKALDKLKKMSPQDIEELDKRLAQALTLFYDREYARALPIFREISERVETMDVMFWMAACSAKAGDIDASLKKYKEMLVVDPNLHRVRLEIATVYFEAGRYQDARKELEAVLEAKPPEMVKNNVQRLLATIDERTKRVFTNLRGSVGFQLDDNVSAGPEKEFITIPLGGGTLGPLTTTQKELADWVTVASLAGNILYDFGDRGGWMWNTTGSFYQTHNAQYHQFDFTQLAATTGLWWVGAQSVLKLPVGVSTNTYEHDPLYNSREANPSYEYFFTPWFSLKGTFTYVEEEYDYSPIPESDKSGQDNRNRIWEINPNFYFNNRKDILSFYISDENLHATSFRYTYNGTNAAVSYFKSFALFDWDMEFYTRFKYTKREYESPALLWPQAYLRSDHRYNLYAVLSRNFSKHLFASVSFNWIDNVSNTDLYDFDKFVYAFNVGFKF